MKPAATYSYQCRPGYGSENLLIEVLRGSELETCIPDILDAIKEIDPQLTGLDDLWMNDEIRYHINSVPGAFTLSKDIWGFVFIMADDNQLCLEKINTLLLHDTRFEKIDVDFNLYTLKE